MVMATHSYLSIALLVVMAAAAPYVFWTERFPGSRYSIYHIWIY